MSAKNNPLNCTPNGESCRSAGSTSIGRGQHLAAEIWEQFKAQGLTFADMLELCAVLIVNTADKSKSTDAECFAWARKLSMDMRSNAKLKKSNGKLNDAGGQP
jgi:hypothetical protein